MGYRAEITEFAHGCLRNLQNALKTKDTGKRDVLPPRHLNEDLRKPNKLRKKTPQVAQRDVHSIHARLSFASRFRSKRARPQKQDGLRLPPDMVSSLADALLKGKRAQEAQAGLAVKLDSLDATIQNLDRRAYGFDVRAEELILPNATENSEKIAKMREAARMVRATQDILKNRRRNIQDELAEIIEEMRMESVKLYAMLDDHFVRHQLIPSQTDDQTDMLPTAHEEANCTPAVSGRDENLMIENEHSPGDVGKEEHRAPIARSAGIPSMAKQATYDEGNVLIEAERNYKLYKIFLGQAEHDFETRQDVFDQERDQLMLKRQAGQMGETISQLDKRHILETQKLTRKFAEAEEEFYTAKEAAVAAGVIFGSDVESGFASRPDDGYTLSMEIDGEMLVDPHRITDWLNGLQLLNASDSDAACLDHEEIWRISQKVIDDFDLEPVNLCDSRSAIAEGSSRRRIDKWNLLRKDRDAP